jgi:hypothetical protein
MQRLLKLWLMCLVVLAVSLQGVAAAAMLNCGPVHHGSAPADVHGKHDHSAHSHGDLPQPPGSAIEDETAVAALEASNGADFAELLQDAPKAKCSACASCCSAIALPSGIADLEAKSKAQPIAISAGSPATAFLTSGPERPPRHFLA